MAPADLGQDFSLAEELDQEQEELMLVEEALEQEQVEMKVVMFCIQFL